MTHDNRPPDHGSDEADRLLDRAVQAARSGPDPAQSEQARDRVRARLLGPALTSPCDALRPELPALVAGSLPEDRADLVADHCRECVSCRREFVALRDGRPAAAPARATGSSRGRRWFAPLAGLAAAAALGALVLLVMRPAVDGAPAILAEIRGHVLDAETGHPLDPGSRIRPHQALRTAKNSRAVLELPDGSRVELNERAQASFHADGDALTLDLVRGDIIFEAAPRKERTLSVRTSDFVVAVQGTVFTVRHGLKGSRVGVLEGSVHVAQGGATRVLGAGDQVATDPSLDPQPLSAQVGWSLDAGRWGTLLSEIEAAAAAVENARPPRAPRFQSAILDAMPDSTVFFAAHPNDGELSALASEISARVASNPRLADWWQAQLAPASGGPGLARLLDTLRRLSDSLGDEVVLALLATGDPARPLMPVLAAGLRDERELRRLVSDLHPSDLPRDAAPLFLTAEELAARPAGLPDEPMLVLHAQHVLVGPSADALRAVIAGFDGAPHGTRFLSGLEGHYDRGAEFLVAADLASTLVRHAEAVAAGSRSGGHDVPSRLVGALGLSGVDQFVLTAGTGDPGTAVLSFHDQRHGMAAWLAAPGPMGSLDLMTADASLAGAALFEDPDRMLADLAAMLPEGRMDAITAALRDATGRDLASDLAASLGGEMALALDGPLLPHPSWKLILEVDDARLFEEALLSLAEEAARRMPDGDRSSPLLRETKTSEGPARALRLGPLEVHYALVGGYFVAVPSLQLLEASLQARARGLSLASSQRLVGLLPGGEVDELSLLVWQDASGILGDLAASGARLLPPEAAAGLSAAGPSAGWARASGMAIAFGMNSPEGGLGAGLSSLLRRGVVEALAHHALTLQEAAREDAAPAGPGRRSRNRPLR